ncbi:MAG: hypothetical protein CSA25_00345 [Desulfobacter postgatei]|uniref:Uncharacterized protein n=1 Tax=Desulfobacter postgatei TaxID=2293 RepID=A0A2G6MTY6_9BACT|nr:MAG: hypothetical protein CSA25_00345 [Desulfobacter postgatei]
MSCKKAIGVAKEMKNRFGEKISLNIFTTDSEEARKYDFRSATNVLFESDLIPLEISLDEQKMTDFLSEKLS